MRKIIPLVLAIICIVIFSGLMWKNESHLKNSQSIYVRLQPVDPRSLIQGDYMVLDYQLYLAPESTAENQSDQIYSGHSHDQYIHNKSSVPVYVELNAERIVIHTYFDRPKATSVSKLILKNPNNRADLLYPASKSFLFSEGLAECYQQAQYAEFKVDSQGNAILASLRGGGLRDLGCGTQRSWFDGFQSRKSTAF